MTSQERLLKFEAENDDLALRTSVVDCQIAIRRLLDDLAAAREDVADMDWLDTLGDNGEIVIDGDLEGERVVVSWNAWNPTHCSARAAIRAERAARAGGTR